MLFRARDGRELEYKRRRRQNLHDALIAFKSMGVREAEVIDTDGAYKVPTRNGTASMAKALRTAAKWYGINVIVYADKLKTYIINTEVWE